MKRVRSSVKKHARRAGVAVAIGVQSVHRATIVRGHEHLTAHVPAYRNWHSWKHHKHVHHGVLAVVLVAGLLNVALYRSAFAVSDITKLWDFSNQSEYTLSDPNALEYNGTSVRLKAQNYVSDANTMALYHADDASGSSLSDSSGNGNSATLTNTAWGTGKLGGALQINGSSSSAQAANSASLSLTQSNSIEAWVKLNNSFAAGSTVGRQTIVDKGPYKLYLDDQTGKAVYELQNSSVTTWQQQAGNSVKGSWDFDGKTTSEASVALGTDVYFGTGNGPGDAEVWKQSNAGVWTQIGGSGLNGSWPTYSTYRTVGAMATDGTNLYVGVGSTTTGDGDVWKYNGSTWTKIGGDGINSGWVVNTFEAVTSLNYFGGNLYAGLGTTGGDGDVWKYNGSTWTQIGGDGVGNSWAAASKVNRLENDGTNLYAGTGNTAGMADVWRYNGSTWTQIGGDGLNSSWAASTYEEVLSSFYMGSNLYIGLGTTAGDAEVWRWSGSAWTKLASSGVAFPASTYEGVYSLSGDGTNLFAGVGLSSNEGDVWKYNGSTWTQVGGDGLNSGWTAGLAVSTMLYANSKLYANSTFSSVGTIPLYSYNGTSWQIEGGQYHKGSWGFTGLGTVKSMTTSGGKMYAGMTSAFPGSAIVFEFNGTSWSQIGGNTTNGSWSHGTYTMVESMTSYNGNLIVGLSGNANNDAEVWSWNGSTWTILGGDGTNSSWNTSFTTVKGLTAHNGILYAGIGSSLNNAEVWKLENGAWAKIGGGGTNNSWNNVFRYISAMSIHDGTLVVGGTGSVPSSAEVWSWNPSGSTWTKIGGDGAGSSWNSSTYLQVNTLMSYKGSLYSGIGGSAGDGEMWKYNGSTWTQVGGDNISSSWDTTTYLRIASSTAYNGDLYVGTAGGIAGDGDMWKYDGSSWTQVGGDSISSSWTNAIEGVQSSVSYKGKLYAGLGDSVNSDAMIYSLGNNGYLESSTTNFNTDWRHIAATYDGSTMKLFLNGQLDATTSITLSMSSISTPLLIGAGQGSPRAGASNGVFAGSIDEVRISNVARSSFTTKPYTTSRVGVRLTTADYADGVASWDGLAANFSADGATVAFRLSIDGGASWKYWDGAAWSTSTGLNQASSIADVNANLGGLAVTTGGIMWQAVLQGDGEQRPQINSVTLSATSDATAPSQNADNIVMKTTPSGSLVAQNGWTNAPNPYFTWDPAIDNQSSIAGYCLYLGQSSSEDPLSAKGLLGTSPLTLANCPFAVSGTELNLVTSGLLASPLTSSNTPYYLSIKAVDNAGNPVNSSEQFHFRYDNTAPSNPLFVSTPSQFVSNKQVTITWPTVGGDAAADSHSLVAGMQYRIGSGGTWYGDSHNGAQDMTDLLANDGSYQTIDPTDFDNLNDGNNTIYFRSWDTAGNVSTAYVTGVIKINTSSPSVPQNLTATPSTNTTNSFGFDWLAPASFGGSAANLTYCYTINTLPSVNTCSFTPAGVTSLAASAYATQPGANTIYVVAKDESGNINYAAVAQATFTANTSAPGVPLNADIADISVKATSNWKLAVSWEQPTDVGAGVAQYRVYRSVDDVTYAQVASTSGTSYVDTGLDSVRYYYKLKACDSANNCGALTLPVNEKPTGKYTTAAGLVSDPVVSDVSTRRVTISWSTDRESDSRIQFGKSSGNYFATEVASSQQTTAHGITINNLTSGTTYYARARWTDEDGNIGSSDEFTFSTSPAPTVKEVTNKQVGLGSATVQFTTKEATKVKILYGKSESFGSASEVNTSTQESTYTTVLANLEDGTKYYYKLNTYDSEDNEYEGNVYSLITPARPRISNLRFEPVEGEPTSTQRISWTTNVPATSEVTYSAQGQPAQDKLDSQMVSEHSVTILGLADDSVYSLVARSRDGQGNAALSETQTFRTALDTRPPKIADVVVKSAVRGSGSDARGQIIVSWHTDEPSTSQVSFGQGSQNGELNSRTAEDAKLVTEHLVIVSDLTPSKVYQVQALAKDRSGNQAKSLDQTTIVGKAPASIFDIVFKTLQGIFSFIK